MAASFGPVVTDAVTEAVAATVAAQPDDPVDYLGRYLLKFVTRKEAEHTVSRKVVYSFCNLCISAQ